MIAQHTIQAVFAAWQQPQTRRYYPVARLAAGVGEIHDLYEFAYVQGAHIALEVGFQPFLAFPDLQQVYRSRELFPFFTNRLMSRKRPDFRDYIQRLGLDPSADDMTILARSGGVRATDSIEMFPLPVQEPNREWFETWFWVHGVRHRPPENQQRILTLRPGEPLISRPEPTNQYDSNAIQLLTQDGVFVGYIPRYLAGDACELLECCTSFDVFVERVNPDPAPVQQRLLCRVETCWPDGFVPCDSDSYKPISSQAEHINPCGEFEI